MRQKSQVSQRRKFLFLLFVMCCFMLVAGPAAAQGITKVNSMLDNVTTALQAGGVALFTIALSMGAYKIMYQGATISELGPKILGGVILGSASAIAGFLIG